VVRWALASILTLIGVLAHAEPQNVSYFCSADATAALKYDPSTGKWAGAQLRADARFTLKLVFNRSYTRKFTYAEEQVDEYLANVIPLSGNAVPCLTVTDTDAVNSVAIVKGAFRCSTMTQQYEFNIDKNRYFKTYNFGYINGSNDDIPTITGGTCIKIDPDEPTVTGTVGPRATH
jgi:hypothetical protein